MDPDLQTFGHALRSGHETARTAPLRRADRASLDRQEDMGRHLDFAARNTRVMARGVLGMIRTRASPAPELALGLRDLALATWALAAKFDDSDAREDPRIFAQRAAARATETMTRHADPALTEIAARSRSTAVDRIRASHAGDPLDQPLAEAATEELIVLPNAAEDRDGHATTRPPPFAAPDGG
jgi:hypothetical protein